MKYKVHSSHLFPFIFQFWKLLKHYLDVDLNKDFHLSEDEQQYFLSKHSYDEKPNKGDKNGDGKISPEEANPEFSVDFMRKACY